MRITPILVLVLLIAGCTSYATPGPGAKLQLFGASAQEQRRQTDGAIQPILDKKPLASFPTAMAVVRVQGPLYRSYTNCGYGTGRYSVITTRDIEADTDVEKISQLAMLRGVAPLNRLVLPEAFEDDLQLRQAAAKMHADMLLVYTIDTQFLELDHSTPLSVLTLGAMTTANTRIISTASAAILDTRSGYVYGLAEGTEKREQRRNAWKTEDEVDKDRRDTESKAFAKLITNLQTTWTGVVRDYATPRVDGALYQTAPKQLSQ